ncbi:MAG: glutamate racemase [bacterium]
MEKPIAIFDSGIGGVTVLKEIIRMLPQEDIIYFGDIARSPYGSKSESLVIKYANQALSFLLSQEVKLVVIACNTASSVAIESLSQRFPYIIDVIDPVVSEAIKLGETIGVIGTRRTIASSIYQKRIVREGKKVIAKACPLFVPLVEEGWIDHKITRAICEEYLSELKGKIDVLILGCTHYPFLLQTIKETMGDNIHIVNSSTSTAIATKTLLEKEGLLNIKGGSLRFYTSDTPGDFMLKAAGFLDISIPDIQRIDLEEYEGSISRKV